MGREYYQLLAGIHWKAIFSWETRSDRSLMWGQFSGRKIQFIISMFIT